MTALPSLDGWVDHYESGVLSGWAWAPAEPTLRLSLEVVVGDRVLAETVADRARPDLAAAGIGDGHHGFQVAVPLRPGDLDGLKIRRIGVPDHALAINPAAFPAQAFADTTLMPVALGGPLPIDGFLDHADATGLRGWITHREDRQIMVAFEVWSEGRCLARGAADRWRLDLADSRQGDGRWAFSVPVPDILRDDRIHEIDLRLPDGGPSILTRRLRIQVPPATSVVPPLPEPDEETPNGWIAPIERPIPDQILFSVIVVFYNMRREAARTLTSLSRAYQRGIGTLPYEVICIDNGSTPPLDPDWIASFGPEFRLIRPEQPKPSPCEALNRAVAEARGRYLALMIDGAHILTPGVFREVWDEISAHDQGAHPTETGAETIVALRPWFIGGDQRWLSLVDYRPETEDLLFGRIDWPSDGYRLFEIGFPANESPDYWFCGLVESNCLFLPRALFQRIGGFDEAFDRPGAGFANLDLFVRAAQASGRPVTALIGEGSFHQFHGGTTTNVDEDEKEARVRAYESEYLRLRGRPFQGLTGDQLRLRGHMRTSLARVSRHQLLPPLRLGITDRVRPGQRAYLLGLALERYLQAGYVETRLDQGTRWRGEPVGMAPADLVNIQEILHRLRPERIIAANLDDPQCRMLESFLTLIDHQEARILQIAPAPGPAPAARVTRIVGDLMDPATRAAINLEIGTVEHVMVLYRPRPQDYLPLPILETYGGFVTLRSYLIVLDTVRGQPWLTYSRYWFFKAIRQFIDRSPFEIDSYYDRQLVSTCAGGYLVRTGGFDASPGLTLPVAT